MIPPETNKPVIRHEDFKKRHAPTVRAIVKAFAKAIQNYGEKPKNENPSWTQTGVTLHRERLTERLKVRLKEAEGMPAEAQLKVAYTAMQLWFATLPPGVQDKIKSGGF